MTFTLDAELAPVLAAEAATVVDAPIPKRGDWRALRAATDLRLQAVAATAPKFAEVSTEDHQVATPDGGTVVARWYRRTDSIAGPAVVYAHGGGMICGSVDSHHPVVSEYVERTGVPFLSVDYRLAPEHPGLTPAEDVFAALAWLRERGVEFGVDPARIALMGDSGGGGVAAGAVLLARDRGVDVARQILVYPMLDDRTIEPDSELVPTATWSYDANYTGWRALLGDALGSDEVSPVAAPGRNLEVSGLPPAYVEVGELDIFRDECVAYASRLWSAGISAELHVHPGAPHSFERIAPDSVVARTALGDRIRVINAL